MKEIQITPTKTWVSDFDYVVDNSNRRFWGKLDVQTHLDVGLPLKPGIETYFIQDNDGQRVVAQVSGDPNGSIAYLLHGSPGSQYDQSLYHNYLRYSGLQVVTIARDGYSLSDSSPGRRIAKTAERVQLVADKLEKPPEYVIGRSGGASGALACSVLPDVKRVAALVPLAPREALGDSWYEGMTEFNVTVYQAAEHSPEKAARMLDLESRRIITRQRDYAKAAITRHTYQDPSLLSQYLGLVQGPEGWIHDSIAAVSSWGYDPTMPKKSVETLIWSCGQDLYTGIQHSLWLAENIPGAQLHVQPEAKHITAAKILPEILNWCLTGEFNPLT